MGSFEGTRNTPNVHHSTFILGGNVVLLHPNRLQGAVVIVSNGSLIIGCNQGQLRRSGTTRGMLEYLKGLEEPSPSSDDGFQTTSASSGKTFFKIDLGLSRVHLDANHTLIHLLSSATSEGLVSGVHNSNKVYLSLSTIQIESGRIQTPCPWSPPCLHNKNYFRCCAPLVPCPVSTIYSRKALQ